MPRVNHREAAEARSTLDTKSLWQSHPNVRRCVERRKWRAELAHMKRIGMVLVLFVCLNAGTQVRAVALDSAALRHHAWDECTFPRTAPPSEWNVAGSRAGWYDGGLPAPGAMTARRPQERSLGAAVGQLLMLGEDVAPEEALRALWRATPEVLVSDIELPEEDGCALIRNVRALAPEQDGKVPALPSRSGCARRTGGERCFRASRCTWASPCPRTNCSS